MIANQPTITQVLNANLIKDTSNDYDPQNQTGKKESQLKLIQEACS